MRSRFYALLVLAVIAVSCTNPTARTAPLTTDLRTRSASSTPVPLGMHSPR